MNERIFEICNAVVVPGWLLLAALPRWKYTQRICAVIVPIILAVFYLALFVLNFNGLHGGFLSLAAVAYLFQQPATLLAAWIHLLAFDLFVGAWIVRDSKRVKVPHLAVIPCLLLTVLLGPVGVLTYFIVRSVMKHGVEAL
jgi:Domain of unknown function (DUF4281)